MSIYEYVYIYIYITIHNLYIYNHQHLNHIEEKQILIDGYNRLSLKCSVSGTFPHIWLCLKVGHP